MTTKRCTKCGKIKPLAEFARQRTTRDGRTYWCRGCHAAYAKRHKAQITENKRRYYETHREHWHDYYQRYNKRHRARLNARSKRYYKIHRVQILARARRLRKARS